MKLYDFDAWARSVFDFEGTSRIDSSLNGIQTGNENVEITKIAFAVDACEDSFVRAKDEGAQLLFVHHGLFWGRVLPLTGVLGSRMRFLMNNNLSLYACHLPLDLHSTLGNNAVMAKKAGLENVEPFGDYKGVKIGYKGVLSEQAGTEEIIKRIFGYRDSRINVLGFGREENISVGIISGSAAYDVSQAINEKLDLYITGEVSHAVYHECREAGINVIFAGHYLSETFGVQAVSEKVQDDLGIDTVFLDIPTGY